MVEEATGRLLIDGGGYNAVLSRADSVLTLVSDHEDDTVIFTRASGMPDPNEWVREIEVLEDFPSPSDIPTDLAWDGDGIWFPSGFAQGPLRRMNPSDALAIDRTLAVEHEGNAVAFTDGDFWVDDAATGGVFRVDGATGATRATALASGLSGVRGISVTPDGFLWVGSGPELRLLDPGSSSVVEVDSLYQSIGGLENVGAALYASIGMAGIVRLEGPPWRVVATWKLPSRNVRGIAFDATDWWLYVIDLRGNVATRIVRARLLDSWLEE